MKESVRAQAAKDEDCVRQRLRRALTEIKLLASQTRREET